MKPLAPISHTTQTLPLSSRQIDQSVLWRPPSRLTGSSTSQPVRFGVGGTELWANIFTPVMEDFVTAFLVRDMGGLGVPRSVTSAIRGRNPYEPEHDPNIENRSPLEQFVHAESANVKGLNWPNLIEEILREVQSSPFTFVSVGIVMGLAAAAIKGGSALLIGRPELAQLNQSFIHHVKQAASADGSGSGKLGLLKMGKTPSQAANRLLERLMMSSMSHHFVEQGHQPVLKWPVDKAAQTAMRFERQEDKLLFQFLNRPDVPKTQVGNQLQVTYKDAFKSWVKAWNKTRLEHNRVGFKHLVAKPLAWPQFFSKRQSVLTKFNELETAFKQMVYTYNLKHQPFEVNPDNLRLLRVKGLEAPGKASTTSVDSLLRNLQQFPGFMRDVFKQSQTKSGFAAESVINVASKLERSLVKGKAISSILSTFACFCAVGSVSWIAQHNHSYPANRNMVLDALNRKSRHDAGLKTSSSSVGSKAVIFGNETQTVDTAGKPSMQLKQLPRIHIQPQLKQLARIHILAPQSTQLPDINRFNTVPTSQTTLSGGLR